MLFVFIYFLVSTINVNVVHEDVLSIYMSIPINLYNCRLYYLIFKHIYSDSFFLSFFSYKVISKHIRK